jgi:hypothetical protein
MNPEGISSSSPGLAFFSQPWEIKKSIRYPEKGCVGFWILLERSLTQPRRGWISWFCVPQGCLKNVNPGLKD